MKNKPYLKEGEVICDKCNGDTTSTSLGSISICTKCWCSGKLDWIEVCTGKVIPKHITQIPKLRKMYPKLITQEIISIQPMTYKNPEVIETCES